MTADEMNPLQRLVVERLRERGLSLRQAAAHSGGSVSHGTLANIATGRHRVQRIHSETLRGVALALDLPLSKVEEAARGGEADQLPEFRLPKDANRLTAQQRAAVRAMVKALLDSGPGQ